MKLSRERHRAGGWLIDRIAPDFELLDVWALPIEGGPDDIDDAFDLLASFDPVGSGPAASRLLFTTRLKIGGWLGWDEVRSRAVPGCSETTLADRLPEPLRGTADSVHVHPVMQHTAGGFTPLYRTGREWAAEVSNQTVHGVLHLSWVEREPGRYGANMAVYVKRRGLLGQAYMALIKPFRHLIVYPVLMREFGRRWITRAQAPAVTRDRT